MKKNILTIGLVVLAILVLSLLRTNYKEHNLKRTISACVLAKKQTSTSFNLEEAKKFCEEEIKNKVE